MRKVTLSLPKPSDKVLSTESECFLPESTEEILTQKMKITLFLRTAGNRIKGDVKKSFCQVPALNDIAKSTSVQTAMPWDSRLKWLN